MRRRDLLAPVLARLWKAPRWIAAVLARMKEADAIACRIPEVSFPPIPWLILRSGLELRTCTGELSHLGVSVFELEVDNYAVIVRHEGYSVQGEGGSTDWALEPRVVWGVVDDQAEAEPQMEGNGVVQVGAGCCHLVEVHDRAPDVRSNELAFQLRTAGGPPLSGYPESMPTPLVGCKRWLGPDDASRRQVRAVREGQTAS